MTMNAENEKHDECRMTQTDAEGNPNLCCCYMLNSDNRYEDPCYHPVGDCCYQPAELSKS